VTPILGDLRRRLRPTSPPELVTREPLEADESEATALPGREVEFAAYAEDCRLFGFMRLRADRMTDVLNDQSDYSLTDVMVVRLADGVATQMVGLTVHRDELLAVRAAGPRGDPARRSRRRPFPITLQTGPYIIHGYVHGFPGADPIQQIRRRLPMVPLTESWIEYQSAGQQHRARVGTIIVNHESWDWARLSRDDEVKLPDLPAETKPDPRVKDFTGDIYTPEADEPG
jgi:hypothetical protein